MSEQPTSHPSCLYRIINWLSLFYLLLMLAYAICRYGIQDRLWFISLLNTFAIFVFIPLPILLLLALLMRSRRAALYLLPVLLWLAIWFGPRFLPKNTAGPANTSPFRVMTNNVSHFNQSPERITEATFAQNPDVIFFQEVQLGTQKAALAPLDNAYPYQTRQADTMRSGMYDAYNVTYSRFPFVVSKQVDPHMYEMPLIYRNVIEINGQRVALYSIHLLSPGGGGRLPRISGNYFVRYALDFDDTIRNRQVNDLLTFLTTEEYPFIVAGDFNTSDFSMSYAQIAAQLHDSFAEVGVGLGSSWPAARAFAWSELVPPFIRIDYIWHSAGLQAVNAWRGNFTGSDHLPMFADLTLSP
jgi:vancomycin resistance protein VanJ